MARDLATTLTELDSAIKAENSAWAASRGHAENAHLAAVARALLEALQGAVSTAISS